MSKEYVLITGANGEIGHSLITQIHTAGEYEVVALDISPLDECLADCCCQFLQCNILDEEKLAEIFSTYHFSRIFHLASILSTRAESNPVLAQKVNVQGTVNILEQAALQSRQYQIPTKIIYPSSIAVYGFASPDEKKNAGRITEFQALHPITMYGVNKLTCEMLGNYYANHYRLLEDNEISTKIDFRVLRFPGLISAFTIPSGGTSDYGPEMLHHAVRQRPYTCFVQPDTTLPFMVMPDAVRSILMLADAPAEALTQSVYNVTSFNPSAKELETVTQTAFPGSEITYIVNHSRQKIVDSWPMNIDDGAARCDWGWEPEYDFARAFNDYLIPNIRSRYS